MQQSKASPLWGSSAAGLAWAGAFATWLGITGFALATLTNYAGRPGAAAQPITTAWPPGSKLPKNAGHSALVMIAHTKCACTRSSLRELERLMARARGDVDAFVVFVGPTESSPSTGLLDLRAAARAIPGVHVTEDPEEARLFGAMTSGQVYLYDAGGTLLFQGGITPARGHEGESRGGETVRRFVTDGAVGAEGVVETSNVFGCGLFARQP